MNGFHRYQCDFARQQVNRVMSMLVLIEAGLRLEMDFQDEKVNRPLREPGGAFIPGLGEVIDALLVSQETLQQLWEDLGKEAP